MPRLRAESQTRHDIAELTHRVEGEQPLQVGLRHGKNDADQHRQAANQKQEIAECSMPRPDRIHSGDQISARLDIAGRVQQRRNRRWRIHRLGDPGMQRIHDRLGHCRHDHQQDDGAGKSGSYRGIRPQEGSGPDIEKHDRSEQSVAGNMRNDQHLARPVCGLLLLVPEADQEIGAQADDFPREVGHQQIGGAHQHHEAADENQHQHIETGRSFLFLFHVSDGIEQDRRTHASTEQHEKNA